MPIEWRKDADWSSVYSYAMLVDGEMVGRVFQGKVSRDWKGFLHNGDGIYVQGENGTLEEAKNALEIHWKKRRNK